MNVGNPLGTAFKSVRAKVFQNLKWTFCGNVPMCCTSQFILGKRPILICLVRRLPHRKEFRRKKLENNA